MIATLLGLALQLLLAAQQPNVPDSVRQQAIQVATIAIKYAQDNATSTEQLIPSDTPTQATITVTPINDQPVFGAISTTTDITINQSNATVTPVLMPLTFTGWDGSKVVLSGGAEATTIITVASGGSPVANASIQIYNDTGSRLIVDDATDANGEYVFKVGENFRGSFDVKVKVPSLNIDQTIPFLVSN